MTGVDLATLATRPVDAAQATALTDRLEQALHAHSDAPRIRHLTATSRARSARLTAMLGLALVTTAAIAGPAEAGAPVPAPRPVSAPVSVPGHPERTTRAVTATTPPRRSVTSTAADLAGDVAALTDVLGYQPPTVSIDDLEEFIRYSFTTESRSPYTVDDELNDPLDRGVNQPVAGTRAVETALAHYRARLAAHTAGQPVTAMFDPSDADPVATAREHLHAGDVGTFRLHLFSALANATELTERTFLLALIVSLDDYDPLLRQQWLDRITAWRTGTPPPAYAPAHTDTAISDYACAPNDEYDQRKAATARLVDSYLDRILTAAHAERVADQARLHAPTQPKVVRINPARHRTVTREHGGHA